jgi:hypothetical protein
MAVAVFVLNVGGGGGVCDTVGGFFADLVRSFGAADIGGISWGVLYEFHGFNLLGG